MQGEKKKRKIRTEENNTGDVRKRGHEEREERK